MAFVPHVPVIDLLGNPAPSDFLTAVPFFIDVIAKAALSAEIHSSFSNDGNSIIKSELFTIFFTPVLLKDKQFN